MTKKQNTPHITHAVKFLFNLWRLAPAITVMMIVIQVVFTLLSNTIAPIFVSRLLTDVAKGNASLHNSAGLLIGYVIILFLGTVVGVRIVIFLAYKAETRMQAKVANQVLDHLMEKSIGYHSNNMSGGTVSNATKLNSSIERFWDTIIFSVVPIVTTIAGVSVALTLIFWQYGIALAGLSICFIFIMIRLQTKVSPKSRMVAERSSAMTAYFADVISNIGIVKAFSNQSKERQAYQAKIQNWQAASRSEISSVLLITGTFSTLMTFMNIAAFVAAIFATQYHIATIGTVYLVISYTLNVVSQLFSVSGLTRGYLRIVGDSTPMITTLQEPVELKDIDSPLSFNAGGGNVDFNHVTFSHEDEDEALFNDFNLHINAGERIGLVGRSGSGKTTLTRLLLRFSDIDDGTIEINNQDISKIRQNDLRQAIAYVPQEPALFHRSIAENIAYGKTSATREEIIEAARQANAFEFIDHLPEGFDTIVGERGVKLSGGQRQRIAIARAIIKNAPILLLDEATSALDSESEKLIQDALKKLMKDRTSIVIAHRLSTIASLDRIVVLSDGAIDEQGSHKELLEKDGTYAMLWSHQTGDFIEEE